MLKQWQFWSLTGVAAFVALLTVVNIVLYSLNRSTQTEIAGRAQYVQQSTQLQVLYQEIVKALADLSVRKQDRAVADLLARQGITVTVNAPAATGGSSDNEKRGSKR